MTGPRSARSVFLVLACIGGLHSAHGVERTAPTDRLRQTRAVNMDSIVAEQFPHAPAIPGFSLADPYAPDAAEMVSRWIENPGQEVCAIRFLDETHTSYELKGFGSSNEAAMAGYAVTHHGRCGSCSGLQDLAVYVEVRDLTTPARDCARRSGLKRKKQCFIDTIGFTARCAESWAYNARNTRQHCLKACISDYGFWNLLFKRYPASPVDESGQLRPCLQCDEDRSGPGFKYSAGRTRRNSGIESAIPRPDEALSPVDHAAYFPIPP